MASHTSVGGGTSRSPLLLRLLLVAALPIVALGWFVDSELGRLASSQRAVEEVDRSTLQLVADLELLGAVRTERIFAVGTLEARAMGVGPDLVAGLIGIDMVARSAAQFETVDAALGRAGRPTLVPELGAARSASDVESMSLAYDSIEASIEAMVASSSATVKAEAARIDGGAVLLSGSYTLDALLRHERALREQLAAFFASVDPLSGPIRGIRADLELAVQTRAAEDSFAELGGIDQGLARSVRDASTSSEVQAYDAAISERLVGGVEPGTDLAQLGTLLDAGLARIDAVGRVLLREGEAQRAAAAELGRRAGDQRQDRLWATLVIVAWTVVTTSVVSVSVSRPLVALARDARAVGRGVLPAPRQRRRGPREVVEIRTAFDELTQNLGRAQTRMIRLAGGDTDTDIETAAGPLADAVDATLDRLRSAIRVQDALRAQLQHDATHDALTGVLNRAGLAEVLESARNASGPDDLIAIFCIDLDGFKPVNDAHGHRAGDAVLVEVARRIRRRIGDDAVVARVGGDEFVVAIPTPDGPRERLLDRARSSGRHLVSDLSEPIVVGDQLLQIGASVGLSIGAAADDHDDLQLEADLALYDAKSRGKGCVACFEPSMREHRPAELGPRRQVPPEVADQAAPAAWDATTAV